VEFLPQDFGVMNFSVSQSRTSWFTQADLVQPLALRVVSCLVDPDLLIWVCELGNSFSDNPHLRWRVDVGFGNNCATAPLLLQEGATATAIAPSEMRIVREIFVPYHVLHSVNYHNQNHMSTLADQCQLRSE
jgi:hypothetical protein